MRKTSWVLAVAAVAAVAAVGCAGQAETDDGTSTAAAVSGADLQAGKDTWFKSTFGGQHFFTQILPKAPFNLPLGFGAVLTSDRQTRVEKFGVINDPDCRQGEEWSHCRDKCADGANLFKFDDINGASSGLVGVR